MAVKIQLIRWSWDRLSLAAQISFRVSSISASPNQLKFFYCQNELNWVSFFKFELFWIEIDFSNAWSVSGFSLEILLPRRGSYKYQIWDKIPYDRITKFWAESRRFNKMSEKFLKWLRTFSDVSFKRLDSAIQSQKTKEHSFVTLGNFRKKKSRGFWKS